MLLRILVSLLLKVQRTIFEVWGFEEICKILRIARTGATKLLKLLSNERTLTVCLSSNRVAMQRKNIKHDFISTICSF